MQRQRCTLVDDDDRFILMHEQDIGVDRRFDVAGDLVQESLAFVDHQIGLDLDGFPLRLGCRWSGDLAGSDDALEHRPSGRYGERLHDGVDGDVHGTKDNGSKHDNGIVLNFESALRQTQFARPKYSGMHARTPCATNNQQGFPLFRDWEALFLFVIFHDFS